MRFGRLPAGAEEAAQFLIGELVWVMGEEHYGYGLFGGDIVSWDDQVGFAIRGTFDDSF